MSNYIHEKCGGDKGWVRIANVDMKNKCHECPGDLVEIKENETRLCTRKDREVSHGCSHALYDVKNISYTKVCGKVIGYQKEAPDAFKHVYEMLRNGTTIEKENEKDSYVDGVSIITTKKTHIWTFAAAQDEEFDDSRDFTDDGVYKNALMHRERQCPCSVNKTTASEKFKDENMTLPSFVGEHYFCDSGTRDRPKNQTYLDDPLWDGDGCGAHSTCCTFNSPPYFKRDNLKSTTDDIDFRLCAWYRKGYNIIKKEAVQHFEDTPLEVIELYIQ